MISASHYHIHISIVRICGCSRGSWDAVDLDTNKHIEKGSIFFLIDPERRGREDSEQNIEKDEKQRERGGERVVWDTLLVVL